MRIKRVTLPSILVILTSLVALNGAVTVIDFGTSEPGIASAPNVLFTGSFDDSTGFIEGTVPVANGSNTLSIPLGDGANIEFSNVGGWGNAGENDGPDTIGALSQSYLFAGGGVIAGTDATFTISGVEATDTVKVEFIGGPSRVGILNFNGSADVTIGATPNPTAFTQIGADATGSTSYSGNLIGTGGETNFSAARITIITDDITDPTDSDGDTMGDNWENFYFGDLTTSDGTGDSDTDDATDLQEWTNLSNPTKPDTDGDELTDGEEINTYSTDPTSNDSDDDGLPDGYEIANNLDPNVNTGDDGATGDPDLDTLDNITELGLGTDPNKDDTDEDGYKDAAENNSGFWFDETSTGTDPLNPDTDGDGLEDGIENPDLPFDAGNPATQPGTDPGLPDTDSDGVSDRVEIENGTDPTNAASTPPPSPNVLSADFQGIPGIFPSNPVLMDGANPQTNYLSGTWNALDITGHDGTDIDPTWIDLLNAQGNPTSVSVNVTGVISAWTNASNGAPIFDDYLFVNAGNADPEIAWSITGLRPESTYKFFPYGGVARDHTMTVDTNGDGDLNDETPTRVPPAGGIEFTVTSDAAGQITGTITPGNSGEANWGGFELVGNLPGASGQGLVIEAINYDGEDVTLTWTSTPGATYDIEASTDLKDWTPVSTGINAAASPATTTSQIVDTTFDATKYYRVVEQ